VLSSSNDISLEDRLKILVNQIRSSNLLSLQYISFLISSKHDQIGSSRLKNSLYTSLQPSVESSSSLHESHSLGPEVVLSILVYNFPKISKSTQRIHVLGSNKLSELCDVIYCVSNAIYEAEKAESVYHDHYLPGLLPITPSELECHDKVDVAHRVSPFNKGPSLFYLENNFYEDQTENGHSFPMTKYDDAYTHVKVISILVFSNILGWIKDRSRESSSRYFERNVVTDYKCLPMGDVTFSQLKIKFNFPYLFMHFGNCEHIIVFQNLR
jgi:snRNA-activating protein complex (SNAPc), subunit 3